MSQDGYSEESREWQDIKKVIRSVLLSDVKKGMKLGAFGQRFRELNLTHLEPRKFGFNTALDMLKAMPDVVRFETSGCGNEVVLHAEVQNLDNVYLTPAVKRMALKNLNSDSESEVIPRKKAQDNASIFIKSDSRGSGFRYHQPRISPRNFEFSQNPRPTVTQKEEIDPVRIEIADQMKPNTRGYYAILVPRKSINNIEEMEDIFSVYGEIKDVSRTESFCFIRYQYRHQAVSAVLDTRDKMHTRVPVEKGNPARLIKAKDIVNKPSCNRHMANDVSAPLITAGSMKEENLEEVEVFIGNINTSSTEADVLKLFMNYNIKSTRFVTKDIKRFAFFTVVGLDEAERMCRDLHKTVLGGRELVVQVSYVSTNECMPAIEPAIPAGDMQKFTNSAPRGIYKQFTNFDDKDDSDEEVRSLENNGWRKPASLFTRWHGARNNNYGSEGWRPSLMVNLPNTEKHEEPDDMPALEEVGDELDYRSPRTVVYHPSDDSDMEYNMPFGAGSQEFHVVLERFPHQTHFKQIYKEFKKIGIERLKVDIVNNYLPNPTLAIVTFDKDASVQEALKWDGEDFNHQPMYIRRLDPNNEVDVNMLKKVQDVRKRSNSEQSFDTIRGRGVPYHNRGYPSSRGPSCYGGRGQPRPYHNGQNFHSHQAHSMARGDHSNFPQQRMPYHARAHYPARQFSGRGNMGRGGGPQRFPSQNHRPPFDRGFQHPRGRGRGCRGEHNQHSQSHPATDLFEPTEDDYTLSGLMEQMLTVCFPEGCLPWISKDLPERSEVMITEIVTDRYFFGQVTNGLPGIERKELLRKLAGESFAEGALPFDNPRIRRCGAWYSDNDDPAKLYRAWINKFSEDGQCEVFFIDFGNSAKDTPDKLSVIQDIHWTLRPQIVLFKIDDTSELSIYKTYMLRVLTKNVYENSYVVPVELISSE